MWTRREYLHHTTLSSLGVVGFGICGCRSAPMTGRRQLILMPEESEIALGAQAYDEATGGAPRSENQQWVAAVNRVGQRIAQVSGRADYQWEFRVLAAPDQNAFALPGGKVAVYEGIVPVCMTEGGLAVVMSHEVAHAMARHGGERMSQTYVVDGVGRAVQTVMRNQPETRQESLLKAYGVASKYGVILPYSRRQESEADHVGIMLMARAGYDPEEAPRFWMRFGGAADQPKPPEFLSTHPADETRAANLQKLLPEAQALYAQTAERLGLGANLLQA